MNILIDSMHAELSENGNLSKYYVALWQFESFIITLLNKLNGRYNCIIIIVFHVLDYYQTYYLLYESLKTIFPQKLVALSNWEISCHSTENNKINIFSSLVYNNETDLLLTLLKILRPSLSRIMIALTVSREGSCLRKFKESKNKSYTYLHCKSVIGGRSRHTLWF